MSTGKEALHEIIRIAIENDIDYAETVEFVGTRKDGIIKGSEECKSFTTLDDYERAIDQKRINLQSLEVCKDDYYWCEFFTLRQIEKIYNLFRAAIDNPPYSDLARTQLGKLIEEYENELKRSEDQ